MGTRAVILVTGPHWQGRNIPQTVRLYQHNDGDPCVTLKDITQGLQTAERIRAAQQKRWHDIHSEYLSVKLLADCIIAASIRWVGASVRMDVDDPGESKDTGSLAIYAQALSPGHYGEQTDLEWAYVVNIHQQAVTVYAGFGTVEELMAEGPQPPEILLATIRAPYRFRVRRRIWAAEKSLLKQGWAVNPVSGLVQQRQVVKPGAVSRERRRSRTR